MRIKNNLNNKGIGLIEVIAALGISVIAITALVSLALYTMRLSLQSKLELMGSQTATREREMLRAFRDQSATWADFIDGISNVGGVPGQACSDANGCSMDTATLTPTYGITTETVEGTVTLNRNFQTTIDGADPNIVHVTVNVTWTIGGKQRATHLYTYLTNWRND